MINLLSSLLHIFYPLTCDGCGNELQHTEDVLCLRCLQKLPVTGFHLHDNNPVYRIFRGRTDVQHAMSAYYYARSTLLQHLIHQFKYYRRQDIALHLGKQTGRLLLQCRWIYEINSIIPIPMSPARERQRGYNQATILANGIAAILNKPVMTNILARTEQNTSQTKKNRLMRWQNVASSFIVEDVSPIPGQHVLLIDDVITTGATTENCCRLLLEAGLRVSICSLAYTHH